LNHGLRPRNVLVVEGNPPSAMSSTFYWLDWDAKADIAHSGARLCNDREKKAFDAVLLISATRDARWEMVSAIGSFVQSGGRFWSSPAKSPTPKPWKMIKKNCWPYIPRSA